MSYWPELRDSLMTAARREYEVPSPVRKPTHPRGRSRFIALPRLSSVALVLATVTAIAVAVVALTVIRPHAQSSGSGPGRFTGAANDRAARKAAVAVLHQLILPAGAVRSGLVPGAPVSLSQPSDVISTPHRFDTFAVWRLPESPGRVIAFIQAHRPAGSSLGVGTESGTATTRLRPASRPGAQSAGNGHFPSSNTIDGATIAFNFPGTVRTVIWRELAVAVDRMPGGGSVLRADGQAGWLNPRSAEERFPAAVARVQVTTYKPSRRFGRVSRTVSITSPPRIQRLIGLLNALPVLQPTTPLPPAVQRFMHRCPGDTGLRGFYAFYATGRAQPVATALYNPFCSSIRVTIGGRSEPSLQIGLPNGGIFKALPQIRELMSFGTVPR